MTNSEKKNIIANLHKIEDFCEQEVIPKIKYSNRVSVDFGKPEGCWWNQQLDHSFTVSKDGKIFYRIGGLILRFKPEPWESSSSVYDSWTYGKDLILKWGTVKAKIFAELERIENEHNSIANFEA